MRNIITLLAVALFLASCGGGTERVNLEEQPVTVLRDSLRAKQSRYQALAKDIESLKTLIENKDPSAKKRLPVVTTQMVERSDFAHYTDVQGSVEAEDLVSVSSETGGRIVDLKIQEGQSVRKGQLVAKVDLEQVEKQIAELETQLELANDLYDRQKRLWDQEIGSEVQFLQAKNNKERLEKSLESIKLQLSKEEVYAPISGIVEMLILNAGEIAAPGAPIAQILNTSKVKIVADVPETLIRAVNRGQRVVASIPALDWEKEVRITDLGRTIDKTNRTLKVEAAISNNGRIKPNLLATMRIKDKEEKDVVTIPLELVQQEVGGDKYVMVKAQGDESAIAQKVFVKTGESYDGNVVIEEGLKGGEEIIVKGSRSLNDGQGIEVQEGEIATK
ncbi:MAG: efflux RND transporter periplasmic adaptor subunit [Bacteroidota bacterium]